MSSNRTLFEAQLQVTIHHSSRGPTNTCWGSTFTMKRNPAPRSTAPKTSLGI